MIDSVEAAVVESVRETSDRRVAVIPEGPYIVPVLRTPQARAGSPVPR
jgi:hypothetical protein